MRYAPSVPAGVRMPRVTFLQGSLIAALLLTVASWVFVLGLDREQAHAFFSFETLRRAQAFVGELAGVGSTATPAFADWSAWRRTAGLAYDTLAMSVLAIGIAGGLALATFMFAATNVMLGTRDAPTPWPWRVWYVVVRAVYTLLRAVPELVWAMLLIFVLAPGILPGAVALGLHNWGVLGRLSAEVVEGLDQRPARALQRAGAGRLQVLLYGVLPQALPRFLTYLLYRWEVVIRTTIVVGFVAAGGLGMDFRLSMSHFHYTEITLLLAWYLLLVLGVDLVSYGLRRLAKSPPVVA